MKLSALASGLEHEPAGAPGDPDVAAITHDSRAVRTGSLFAAFPGLQSDGRRFVADAVARGAVAALGLPPAPESLAVPYVAVENPRRAAGLMAALLAGRPATRLVTVGVTGTSGKTTTALLVDRLLGARHEKRGLYGTIFYRGAGGDAAAVPSPHTTPEATELQPMLGALVADGGTAATLECSSHALVLERLAGCAFDAALFLNLSHEHLDFHRDMDDYFEAKTRLFGLLKPSGKAVVNLGDPYGRKLASRLSGDRVVGFFLEGEEGVEHTRPAALGGAVAIAATAAGETGLFATVIGRATLGPGGTRLDVEARGSFTFEENNSATKAPLKRERTGQAEIQFSINSPLLGRPNAENLLAAAATGIALGFSPSEIASSLSSVAVVPGRLERIENGRGLTVLVDYAHKPAALEGVLKTVRPLAQAGGGRVHVVFGCGGDRDKAKRPVMGRIAAQLADDVVVTSDNPRSESPDAIIAEILAGIPAGTDAVALADRRAAIAEALRRARPGDVVLVAGKGHETEQVIAGVAHPFDDRAVLREILQGGGPR
ncbi:MAG TPA: UDP-N-acetylmuramoyl-L-alanyl-D-glutamate--2,6-diaminopimelate ligase [Thermoanaerobaculia bacterium]|nr:UDP-N-acetylmuramoyl-L-alanyl-D-glutamate--2,6-diaminopimelate ligase [Thermoanaerobaculia bacterium]